MPNHSRQEYCSASCFHNSRRIKTKCDWCNVEIVLIKSHYNRYKRHYCCKQHRGFANAVRNGAKIKQISNELDTITWNEDIAYLVGLIATDGTLRKGRKQIKISSSDKNYLEKVSEIIINITGRTLDVNHENIRFNSRNYNAYSINFTSYPFYDFCIGIGLSPNKTYTISSLDIPDEYFSHFLRGIIDGDGNFNTSNKTELLKVANIRIYSGSKDFLHWLNEKCKKVYKISGGNFSRDKNSLGSKEILIFTRVYDNLLIIESVYENAKYYLERRYNQAFFTLENMQRLKEYYRHTYLDGNKVKCKNVKCQNLFLPKDYRHIYCSIKCRLEK